MADPKFQIHAQVRQANRAAQAGDHAAARAMFTALVTDFPDNKRAVEAAANGLARMGDLDSAMKVLDDAMAKMGESPVLLRNRAAHLVAGRRWAAAADTLKRMAQAYPDDIDILLEWGRIAEAAGQIADAEEAFQRGRTLKPDSPEAMLSLAGVLMVREKFDKAEEVLRASIKQHPRLTDARLKLSKLLLRRDRTMDALSAADAAVALDRNAADGHCARGIVLLEMEQPMLAVLAFRRALAIEPKHREARMQLRRLRRGPDPEPLPEVAPPSTPWTGTLITEHAGFGRKVAYAPQGPGSVLKFGESLANQISYKAAALVRAALPSGTVLPSFLDLRCGTGLFLSALYRHNHVRIERAVGVGPSLQKLRIAKRKGVFGEFVEGRGLDALDKMEGQFDLIAALGLFSRTGPLEEAFQKMAGRLTSRGIIVCSIDLGADTDWRQTAMGRMTHSVDYIRRLAKENGLAPIAGEEIVTRIEYTNEFRSYVGVFARV